MVSSVINFAGMQFQNIRGAGHYAKVAPLASFRINNNRTFNFRHIQIVLSNHQLAKSTFKLFTKIMKKLFRYYYYICILLSKTIYIMKTKQIFLLLIACISTALMAQQPVREPALTDEKSFSMIVLPDPQVYNKFDRNQPAFELMTAWIADNIGKLNILTTLCTGDLVEQNEILVPKGTNGNQTSRQQWEAVSRSFGRLDNKLPYVVCTGNHDYGYQSAENRHCNLPKYFYPERNSCWKQSLVSVANNAFGIPTLENAAYEFDTPAWGKLLVVSMEFDPRGEVLEWVKELTASDRFKTHKVILLTHSYMNTEGKVIEKENYKVSPANYGKDIWEKLIYPSDNIIMLVCGHACKIADNYKDNVAFRIDKNAKGRNIPQMMFNAQTADGSWHGNGGDGWLRILEFLPDGRTIKVQTYSPLLGFSKLSADKAWRTDSFDEFDITIEK